MRHVMRKIASWGSMTRPALSRQRKFGKRWTRFVSYSAFVVLYLLLKQVPRAGRFQTSYESHVKKKYTCSIGRPPWLNLDARKELQAFNKVFVERPGGENKFGASFFHYFALWCTIRSLQPKFIIESGINQGVGSWFLRQAAGPAADMVFISPRDPVTYKDSKHTTLYFTEKEFLDFSKIEWDAIIPAASRADDTIIFFDDHQAGVRRIEEAREAGFKHLVFDDNYLPGCGDNLSPKMICLAPIYPLLGATTFKFLDNFGKETKNISAEVFYEIQSRFYQSVDIYAEFPPVWRGSNRFGVEEEKWEKLTQDALFLASELAFVRDVDFHAEARRYTHILYIQTS